MKKVIILSFTKIRQNFSTSSLFFWTQVYHKRLKIIKKSFSNNDITKLDVSKPVYYMSIKILYSKWHQ